MVNATSKSSRLIGCYQLHPYVIPLPSTMSLQLTEDDEFIVLANAAFWACTSHEEVVAHVRHISNAKMAASKLRDMALAYGNKEEVSIIVIYLSGSGQFMSHHASVSSEDSPLLHHHIKCTTTSKLSRPKTFHGESDLYYSTVSLDRTKQLQDTTTYVVNPSIERSHSKSVKELYSKPAGQVKQPKMIASSPPDDNYVNTFKDTSQQEIEVKKKPLEQNDAEWKTPTENTGVHHGQAFSTGLESNPSAKQTLIQFKTPYNNPISHNSQPVVSHDPQPVASHGFQPLDLSHSSSYSTVTDHDSTEAQSLNESANPTWFKSLPPIEFGGNDTFGLELDMISGMPSSSDSNVVLGKRNVDKGWGTRARSYTQPESMRNTDREQAKVDFNFDELLAGLSNTWMTSFPESNDSKNEHTPATKSTMKREDSLFLDNSTLMEQFDQPSGDQDEELNKLISQLSDFVSDTS